MSFTTKDFVNVDGSRTTVYDKISFEEAADFAAKAKLKQEDRALLFVLEVNEASTTEIAEHLGTSASNAGNVVSRLSEDGYLNKGHGNKKIPHTLTREGQARPGSCDPSNRAVADRPDCQGRAQRAPEGHRVAV